MNKERTHRALYAAFDLFPTAKGAATHISKMSEFMFDHYGGGLLFTLGNKFFPTRETEGKNEIIRFSAQIPHYLDRAHAYSFELQRVIQEHPTLEMIHFRDIWSGLGILNNGNGCRKLFEVNGLPSIELIYRYPNLSPKTISKLKKFEFFCLDSCDCIITPSKVIKQNLVDRSIPEKKITVVPNGAEISPEFNDVPSLPDNYLIYFGAVQQWQGMDTLLKAFAGLRDLDLKLVICCSTRKSQAKPYLKMAEKLDIAQNTIWLFQLDKGTLNTWIKNALVSVAPLRECSRNIDQGCSPLKIFESFACGTPVIASDLPVTREIIDDNINGKLVPPDRPQELNRAIRILLEYPKKRTSLGTKGKKKLKAFFDWNRIRDLMADIYNSERET